MGVQRGYSGLINGELFSMDKTSVSDIIQRGGTILRTARCPEFKNEEVRKKAAKILQAYGVEALVVIGGDGSFTGAKLLSKLGLVLLVFYLKSEIDFQQEIEDIIEIKKFDKEWSKMFTDLTLNIMHKGNVMLSEFAMGIYKKMSKHVGKEGVDILIQFLKDTKPKKEKNR